MSCIRRFFLQTSAATLMFAGMLSPVWSQGVASADETAPLQTAAQALAMEAASSARLHNISADEAARRLRVRFEVDEQLTRIRTGFAARYAGGYIVHSPQYCVVMRLTRGEGGWPPTPFPPSGEVPSPVVA